MSKIFKTPDDTRYRTLLQEERAVLNKNRELVNSTNLGAGSRTAADKTYSQIAGTSVSPVYKCSILQNISQQLAPARVLELGTSLGFSSAALSIGRPQTSVITIEGNEEIAQTARAMHQRLGLTQIEVIVGKFEEIVPVVAETNGPFDLIYIDGDHRKVSTLHWISLLSGQLSENGAIIVDDIYWSAEMMEAWAEAKSSAQFKIKIDLFLMGILIRNNNLSKEIDLKIIPGWMKPTQAGIFSKNL
ncbi:MAG: class I SAM-dependent methyltransferase [Saprospiraceae bacterium]